MLALISQYAIDFADLGVFQGFEEGRHANEPDVVVPYDYVLSILSRDLVRVLKHCQLVSTNGSSRGRSLLSNASLPVFSMKSFLSLLYGI